MSRLLCRITKAGRVEPYSLSDWMKAIEPLKGKPNVWVEFEDAGEKRSLPQNAKIQVLARAISEYTGETMKRERDRAVVSALGVEDGLDEAIEILGQKIRPVKSTKDLSKDQGSKVIEWMQNLCRELGFPDTSETA